MKIEIEKTASSAEGSYYSTFPVSELPIGAPFKTSLFVVEPGMKSIVDQHQVKECWFIAQGKGELVVGDTNFTISKNEYHYFQPMETHQVENIGQVNLEIVSIWWNG